MSDDAFAKAEKRGYQRGYAAGKRLRVKALQETRSQREKQAFLERAFMAALPAFIVAQNWTRGEEKIISLEQCVDMAWRAAESAARQRRFA